MFGYICFCIHSLICKGDVTVYRNGEQINRENQYKLFNAGSFPLTRDSSIVLGQESIDRNLRLGINNPNKAFQGILSGFYIWQRVLTANEIRDVYRRQPTMPTDNLITDWYEWTKSRGRGRSVSIQYFKKSEFRRILIIKKNIIINPIKSVVGYRYPFKCFYRWSDKLIIF